MKKYKLGLLLAKTDAAGKSVSYTYTAAGLLASRTWARGIVTTYAYDAWNQLVSTTYSDSTPAVSQTYDALGRTVSTSDAAGTRTTTYDTYGNVASESLLADGKTHLLTELRDGFGRSLGYTYAKNGSVQQTAGTTYAAATGQIATAGFVHGGAEKTFSYNYLSGTNLLESLVCPSNLTIMHTYEAERDLVAGITIRRGTSTNVVLRNYTYDALGRPLTRSTSRNGTTQNDTFGYNSRSELVSATLGADNYAYAFDNIGNRATEAVAIANSESQVSNYSTNNLNQYTDISMGEAVSSPLQYDADGNATLVQTSTGTWQITYNGENRPIRFENAGTQTVVECGYDSQGRRFEKKVSIAGTVELHHRYIYRGYLQIAALDLTRSTHPALWLVTWDPSQPTATRPLAIQKDGTWFTYGYDITKNICEVFGQHGYIRTEYSYAPFGAVSATGDVSQPFQWSSEHYDSELDLVYYNYRHNSPSLGRFLSRDPIQEQGGLNLYAFVRNMVIRKEDIRGLTLLYEEKRVGFDEIWKIRIGSYALTIDGKTIKPGVAIPKLGSISTSEFLEEKKGGCFCAQIVSAPKIEIHVLTLLPNSNFYKSESGSTYTFSDQAMKDLEGHESRRVSVYRNANSVFFTPVETTGSVALKCGRICKRTPNEARYALESYILMLQLEATSQAARYIDEEQGKIGLENTGWDVDITTHENWEELYFKRLDPAVIHSIRPAIATWNTPCPESNS